MAIATVTGAARPAVPLAGQAARPAERRSVLDNLVLTNKAMAAQIKDDILGAVRNPLGTIGGMLEGLVFPFLHPVQAFKGMIAAIRQDPLDGLASAAGTVTGMGWIASVLLAAACVAAAPFTGGASLVVAATAFSVGNAFAIGCIAADAAGIVLHEVRGATAKSSGEAIAEGQILASYVEDEVLNIIAWEASGALESRLGNLSGADLGKMGGRAASEGVGWIGVYDVPAAPKVGRGAVPRKVGGGKPAGKVGH